MSVKGFNGIRVNVVFENEWPEGGTFSILIPKHDGKSFVHEGTFVTPVYEGDIAIGVENKKLKIGKGNDPDTISFQIPDRGERK